MVPFSQTPKSMMMFCSERDGNLSWGQKSVQAEASERGSQRAGDPRNWGAEERPLRTGGAHRGRQEVKEKIALVSARPTITKGVASSGMSVVRQPAPTVPCDEP